MSAGDGLTETNENLESKMLGFSELPTKSGIEATKKRDAKSSVSQDLQIEESPFDILPNELLASIFDKLELEENKQCRLTCSRWCRVLDDPKWEFFLFNPRVDSASAFQVIRKTNICIWNRLVVFGICKPLRLALSHRFIREIAIGPHNTELSLVDLLSYAITTVQTLKISGNSFLDISVGEISQILSGKEWKSLTKLKLLIPRGISYAALDTFLCLMNAPCLKSVTLKLYTVCAREVSLLRFTHLIAELYGLVARHCNTLKDLVLRFGRAASAPVYASHARGRVLAANLKLIERDLKLRTLRVLFENDLSNLALLQPFIDCQNTLTSLLWMWKKYLEPDELQTIANHDVHDNYLQRTLRCNEQTLTVARIALPFAFDMGCLSKCKLLKELTLHTPDVTNYKMELPQLVDLEINWPPAIEDLYAFIVESFPNLEKCRFTFLEYRFYDTDLEFLLSSLKKLKRVSFMENELDWSSGYPAWILTSCRENGLKFATMPVENWTNREWMGSAKPIEIILKKYYTTRPLSKIKN